MFFSKRGFNALSSSLCCSGDKSLLMFRALVALIVVASRVSYLLLRCAPPHGFFFGLSLRSYQFAVSRPFGVHPSVHPRSPPGEYAGAPPFPSRQESAGNSRAPPPQTPHCCSSASIRFPYPPACEASEANFLPPTRKAGNRAWEYSSTPSRLSAILRKS